MGRLRQSGVFQWATSRHSDAFGISEIVTEINTFVERTPRKPEHLFDIYTQLENAAGEFIALLGYGEE